MPIRFVDRASTIAGRISPTLANHAANFDGTFTAAPSRTGAIAAQLQNHGAALSGVFQSNANRVGTIGVTLQAHTAVFTAGTAFEANWAARKAALGANLLFATDFRSTADFVTASTSSGGRGKFGADPNQAANEAKVVRDTTDFISGSACLRLDVPASGAANGAAWICSMNPAWTLQTQGIGNQEVWIQFRSKLPANRLTKAPGTFEGGPFSGGHKLLNIAGYNPQDPRNSRSNIRCEHVLQNVSWRQYPQMYRQTIDGGYRGFGGDSLGNEGPYESSLNDYISQNAIDRGAALPLDQRFCYLNNRAACFQFYPDEWVTYMIALRIQSYNGTTGNRFRVWAARQGATSWTMLYDINNYDCGPTSDGYTGGPSGLWFLTYDEGFTGPGVDTYQKYTQLIVALAEPAIPNDLPPVSASVIGLAAASLGSNQAVQVSAVSGMNPISSFSGASVMEYVGKAGWATNLRRIIFSGVQHTNGFSQYGEYDEVSNNWINEQGIPDGRTDPRHAYAGTDCAADGTHVYHEGNSGADRLWKRTPSGTWTVHNTVLPNYGHVAYHPVRDDFIVGKVWGIQSFNYHNNAFTTLLNRPSGNCMADGGGAATYNRKDQCVYVGKTGGANAAMWKVNAAGTCTQVNPPAAGLGIWDSSNNVCQLYGSANSANKLLAISRDGEAYEYDEVANSWSGQLSSAVFPAALKSWIQGASNKQWFAVPIPELGVIAFFRESPTSQMDSTFYIWKH